MFYIRKYAIILSIFLVTSCTQQPNSPKTIVSEPNNIPEVFFPRLKSTDEPRPFPQALQQGTLEIRGHCIYIRSIEGSPLYLAIWPPHINYNGKLIIDNQSRTQVYIGNMTELSGGVLNPGSPLLNELEEPLPADCHGPYWIVGGIVN